MKGQIKKTLAILFVALLLLTVTVTSASAVLSWTQLKKEGTSKNAPLTVSFTDKSTGSPTSYLWSFGVKSTTTTSRIRESSNLLSLA